MAKKKYYAVAVGRKPGLYYQWFGGTGAQIQVIGFKGAVYKGFITRKEAEDFLCGQTVKGRRPVRKGKNRSIQPKGPIDTTANLSVADRVVIYTDGSSLGNPGPGGYGVVISSSEGDGELSGGFRKTTNNRMELLACIVGLEQLKTPSTVSLYSDSRYVVDGITKGWARKWQRTSWRKSTGEKAVNIDLWKRLLALCDWHDVSFIWVKGHAGNPANERCDHLATRAASSENLPLDLPYEATCSPIAINGAEDTC